MQLPEIAYDFVDYHAFRLCRLASVVGYKFARASIHTYLRLYYAVCFTCVETLAQKSRSSVCTTVITKMPVLSKYAKQCIVALKREGVNYGDVVYILRKEEISTSRQTVRQFYLHYLEDGTNNRRPGSGRPTGGAMVSSYCGKMTRQLLHSFLVHNGVDVLLTTILYGRRTLGWTFRGSAYCQLIREVNKQTFRMGSAAPFMAMLFGLMRQLLAAITQTILLQVSHPV